jgi:hypothetical protein
VADFAHGIVDSVDEVHFSARGEDDSVGGVPYSARGVDDSLDGEADSLHRERCPTKADERPVSHAPRL